MSPSNTLNSDKITLVTSDDLPQRFVFSRSKLMLTSAFFLDLLSAPTRDGDEQSQEIEMTEKAEDLQGFYVVVQGEEVDEMLSTLEYDDWIALGRMANKFDCRIALKEVLLKVWKLIADDNEFSAFFLALTINDKEVVQRLSLKAIDEKWHHEEPCPDCWTDRLEKAYKLRLSEVRNKLLEIDDVSTSCGNGNCKLDKIQGAWANAAHTVSKNYRCSQSVEKQIRCRLEKIRLSDIPPTFCEDCIDYLCSELKYLDQELPSEMDIDL